MSFTLQSWLTRCSSLITSLNPRTQDHYDWVGRKMIEVMGNKPLAKVSVADAADFTASLASLSPNTRSLVLSKAKALFARAVREEHIAANPFRHEKCQMVRCAKDWPYWTDEMMAKLDAACPSLGWRRMMALCRRTGLRSFEARKLAWSDINGDSASVVGKGGELRKFPLVERVRTLLTPVDGAGPCDTLPKGSDISRMAAIIAERAGFPKTSPLHDLRKSCCMDMVRRFGARRAGYVLGHTLAVSMEHYDRLTPQDLAEMAAA